MTAVLSNGAEKPGGGGCRSGGNPPRLPLLPPSRVPPEGGDRYGPIFDVLRSETEELEDAGGPVGEVVEDRSVGGGSSQPEKIDGHVPGGRS